MSGGNSHTIQQVPSRKRMQIRHSFSNERKPPVIQIGKTEERMEIRQSFGANGKINARRSAIRSQTKKTASRRETRRLPAANSRRPTPDRPREAHGAALAITKRTIPASCPQSASAGCIAARGIAANGGPQPKSARCQRYSDAFSSRGSTRFKMTATAVATAMEEVPNTVLTHGGETGAGERTNRLLDADTKSNRHAHERAITAVAPRART